MALFKLDNNAIALINEQPAKNSVKRNDAYLVSQWILQTKKHPSSVYTKKNSNKSTRGHPDSQKAPINKSAYKSQISHEGFW